MKAQSIIISGQTRDGRTFRPSDWPERLYYAVANYGPHGQITFNPFVTIHVRSEGRCVVVDARLRENDPITFSFVTGFARDHALKTFDENEQPLAVA